MLARARYSRRKLEGGARWPGRRVKPKLLVALLAICLAITLREPRFLQASNLEQVALSGTLVCIVALGQALLIIGRQIDLSVGAIVAWSAFVSALWLSEHPDSSLALVFVIGIAVGTALGAGNALLAAGLRIPAIVATLGTLAIYRGGIIVYAGGRQISATILPDKYGAVAQTHILGQSPLVWVALALTVVLGWLARNTRTGRNVYAIGSNPEGAEFAGIGVRRHVALLFVLSGMLCGLTGVLWGARFGTVDAVIAPDLQLQSISAAVVGGVSIFGGSGSVYGAAIGAAIFVVLQNGVQLLGFDQFWIPALLGVAILGTVLLYSRLANRGDASAARMDRWSRKGRAVKIRNLAVRWETFLLLVLAVVLLLAAQASDHFLTASNISIALAGMMPVAIVALPMTLDHSDGRDRHFRGLDYRALRLDHGPVP